MAAPEHEVGQEARAVATAGANSHVHSPRPRDEGALRGEHRGTGASARNDGQMGAAPEEGGSWVPRPGRQTEDRLS